MKFQNTCAAFPNTVSPSFPNKILSLYTFRQVIVSFIGFLLKIWKVKIRAYHIIITSFISLSECIPFCANLHPGALQCYQRVRSLPLIPRQPDSNSSGEWHCICSKWEQVNYIVWIQHSRIGKN